MNFHLKNSVKKLIVSLMMFGFVSMLFVDTHAAPKVDKKSASAIREAQVLQLTIEFEKALMELAKNIKESEPENAKRIEKALKYMSEERLKGNMVNVIKMLESAEFKGAIAEQEGLIKDISALIQILSKDEDKVKEEIERLQRWKNSIKKLIKEEENHIRDTNKVKEKDPTLEKFDAAIKDIKDLIKKQEGLIDKTKEARSGGIKDLEKVAGMQREIRKKTEDIRKKLGDIGKDSDNKPNDGKPSDGKPSDGKPSDGKPSDGKPSDGKPSDGKPSDGKPSDGKPSDGKPSDGKPSDGKPSDGKPSDGKPSDGKPSDGKPSDGKPSDGKPSDGKPSDGKPSDGKPSDGKPSDGKPSDGKPSDGKPSDGKPSDGKPSDGKPSDGKPSDGDKNDQPGQKELDKAGNHQDDAEKDLEKGKGKAAEQDELKAVKELKKALSQLEKERSRIAKLAPEDLEDPQDQTAQKTGDLEKEMKEQEEKEKKEGEDPGSDPGDPAGGKPGEPQPGQKSVKSAKKKMEGAAKDLGKKNPGAAKPKQQDAKDDLEEALEEIEERLAQLREQEQQERLAALEAHFRMMLDIQIKISKGTIVINRKKVDGKFKREHRATLTQLSTGEAKLSQMAQVALDILLEDGTSVVFPRIVEQLGEDLTSVSELIKAEDTGRYPQSVQRDIEETLKQLIEALEKAQQQKDQPPPPPGKSPPPGPQEPPPLLPNSAELKLLRSAQLRVNRRTKIFDDIHPDGELRPVHQKQVKGISKRQEDVAEMTREIVEKQ